MSARVWTLIACIALGAGCAPTPTMYGSTRQVRSGQPIAIAAYPPIAGLGQAVQLTWRIDPDPSFRRWRVAVVSEDAAWERAFEEDLPGRRIQQQRVTPDVPGRYTAVLLVAVETGTARVTRTTFCVVGGDVTCAP